MTYSDVNDIPAGDEEKETEISEKIVPSIELMAKKLLEILKTCVWLMEPLIFITSEAKIFEWSSKGKPVDMRSSRRRGCCRAHD